TINRRDGFGSEFVAVFPSSGNEDINEYILDPLKYNYKNGVNPNIHNARYLAATIVAEPKHATTVEEIINNPEFVIR
ncbi:alpha/beta hydrolase, partial [Acinetobacter baumannii]